MYGCVTCIKLSTVFCSSTDGLYLGLIIFIISCMKSFVAT